MVLRNSKHGPFYGCSTFPVCRGTHGAHPDGKPLGIPADKATRAARIRAHDVFDRIWKEGHMSRKNAYMWLAKAMKRDVVHIGSMDVDECEAVVRLMSDAISSAEDAMMDDVIDEDPGSPFTK
jgi:ssDNA-binding Zn-finger/Zn-ribbon topoisomerase 1